MNNYALEVRKKLSEDDFVILYAALKDILKEKTFNLTFNDLSPAQVKKLNSLTDLISSDMTFKQVEQPSQLNQSSSSNSPIHIRRNENVIANSEREERKMTENQILPVRIDRWENSYTSEIMLSPPLIRDDSSNNKLDLSQKIEIIKPDAPTFSYEFKKTEELVTLMAYSHTGDKITNYAKKNNVDLIFAKNSIIAKHYDEARCKDVISFIEKTHSGVAIYKACRGEDQKKISCYVDLILSIREKVKQILGCELIGFVKQETYNKTLINLSKGSPELEEYVKSKNLEDEKSKKRCIRFLIVKSNAKGDANLISLFEDEVLKKITSLPGIITAEKNTPLTNDEIKKCTENFKDTSVYVIHSQRLIQKNQSNRLVSRESFIVNLVYFNDKLTNIENKKKELDNYLKHFQAKINEILFPKFEIKLEGVQAEIYRKMYKIQTLTKSEELKTKIEERGNSVLIQGDNAKKLVEFMQEEKKKVMAKEFTLKLRKEQNSNLINPALHNKNNIDFWESCFMKPLEEVENIYVHLLPKGKIHYEIGFKFYYTRDEDLLNAKDCMKKFVEDLTQ